MPKMKISKIIWNKLKMKVFTLFQDVGSNKKTISFNFKSFLVFQIKIVKEEAWYINKNTNRKDIGLWWVQKLISSRHPVGQADRIN